VESFTDKQMFVAALAKLDPVLVIIDLDVQTASNNFSVFATVKAQRPTIVTIALASDMHPEKIAAALAAGADDFVVSSSGAEEVRLRCLARLHQLSAKQKPESLAMGDSSINLGTRELKGPRGTVILSPTELAILKALSQAEGQVVERNMLKGICWGDNPATDNALDRHVHGVKAALKSVSLRLKLRAVYGTGYVVEDADQRDRFAS
jgi:DNA-binding response OmpR family regulator